VTQAPRSTVPVPRQGRRVHKALLPLVALACIAASAADPSERLPNPAQEQRARALFAQIRCLVCQNESIDDSEAPLAADLRHIVRQQVADGRSDADIEHFLVVRYGEFVLMKPAFSPANALLWLTPFAIVGLGGATLLLRRRHGGEVLEAPLDADEEARLRALQTPPADAL
jgi:cytochrome c-type biogenesis protein CcmH